MSLYFWRTFWRGISIGGIFLMLYTIPNIFWMRTLFNAGVIQSADVASFPIIVHLFLGGVLFTLGTFIKRAVDEIR